MAHKHTARQTLGPYKMVSESVNGHPSLVYFDFCKCGLCRRRDVNTRTTVSEWAEFNTLKSEAKL